MKKSIRVAIIAVGGAVIAVEAVVLAGSLSGWFSGGLVRPQVEISSEYVCGAEGAEEFINLTPEEYEKLVSNEKSFVIFVDQDGCTTADGLRGRIIEYAKLKGIKINRIMFSDMKETSLHDNIRFYPSVAVVSGGDVVAYLSADSDADAPVYNDYNALEEWLNSYLK